MHDMIFQNLKHLVRSSFSLFTGHIDLDITVYEDSRGRKKLFHKIANDFERGVKNGVNCTPTFFINTRRYNGYDDFENLYRVCRYALDWTIESDLSRNYGKIVMSELQNQKT